MAKNSVPLPAKREDARVVAEQLRQQAAES
jgi:hypothetical protein